MQRVIVIGGGLAGLAATAALGQAGSDVDLFEARPFLGGRATSYPLPTAGEDAGLIDNCQHILLKCCVNLLDLYARLHAVPDIRFHREYYFLEPGGRLSVLRPGRLPPPFHVATSFFRMRCFSLGEKLAILRGLAAIRRERCGPDELDRVSMLDWLRRHRQPERAIARFWRQVLVSAINEELGRMAAAHGIQVFRLGFLAGPDASQMGVPAVPLSKLYSSGAWERMKNVRLHLRTPVERIHFAGDAATGVAAGGQSLSADAFICAVPFERVGSLAPELGLDFRGWEHSPITGIHLWFDRPVTDLPHATLLDRTIQWFFNKGEGRYLLVVVSASRGLVETDRGEAAAMAVRELAEFLPGVGAAKLVRSHVVKELRATFSARPGLERERPGTATRFRNLFLAGDWTRSGWPATMEGAVRSGYLAAEALAGAAGRPARFLLPDIA